MVAERALPVAVGLLASTGLTGLMKELMSALAIGEPGGEHAGDACITPPPAAVGDPSTSDGGAEDSCCIYSRIEARLPAGAGIDAILSVEAAAAPRMSAELQFVGEGSEDAEAAIIGITGPTVRTGRSTALLLEEDEVLAAD